MQILLFSDMTSKRELRGWHRVGHHITYSEHKQRTYNPLLERDINYYELDFQLVGGKETGNVRSLSVFRLGISRFR